MNDIYDEFSDLLGAYALDAVDDEERDQIERHLVDCPRCRAEVAEHREVASYLSQSGAAAPQGVWDRIASELAPPAPPMRMRIVPTADAGSVVSDGAAVASLDPVEPGAPGDPASAAGAAPVVPIGSSSSGSSGRSRPLLAALAVAACLIVVLGVFSVIEAQRVGRGQTIEEQASAAAADSKLKVDLAGDDGSAQAVVGADGKGFLIMDEAKAPADGDVYQLWGKVDGTVLSLGTFGESSVVPFSVDPSRIGDIELFAITQEKAPGVVSSTQEPMMAGAV